MRLLSQPEVRGHVSTHHVPWLCWFPVRPFWANAFRNVAVFRCAKTRAYLKNAFRDFSKYFSFWRLSFRSVGVPSGQRIVGYSVQERIRSQNEKYAVHK